MVARLATSRSYRTPSPTPIIIRPRIAAPPEAGCAAKKGILTTSLGASHLGVGYLRLPTELRHLVLFQLEDDNDLLNQSEASLGTVANDLSRVCRCFRDDMHVVLHYWLRRRQLLLESGRQDGALGFKSLLESYNSLWHSTSQALSAWRFGQRGVLGGARTQSANARPPISFRTMKKRAWLAAHPSEAPEKMQQRLLQQRNQRPSRSSWMPPANHPIKAAKKKGKHNPRSIGNIKINCHDRPSRKEQAHGYQVHAHGRVVMSKGCLSNTRIRFTD